MNPSLNVLENPRPAPEMADAQRSDKGPAVQLDPRTYSRALGCVHCGLCLPACPTYTETGNEADSPRGRIQLMRGLAEGNIDSTPSVRKHLDLCLDCRACETACPSGVVYHELIEETRARFAEQDERDEKPRTFEDKFLRWMFFNIFTHPTRLKFALLPARIMQKIGAYALLRKSGLMNLLPAQLRKMEQMLPPRGALWTHPLPESTPPTTPVSELQAKTRIVSFFPGCIGSVMFDTVNRKSIDLLSFAGATTTVPRTQQCCGAIHHHNGDHHTAQTFARRNIDAFLPATADHPDFITTTIAGCGAMLREYDFLLRDDPEYKDRAKLFSSKVRDISEVLVELNLPTPTHAIEETITYHDACHLAHAQKVTAAPRQLLGKIPGMKMVPLPESDMCCGAAGTYNLQHPEMATSLAVRKLNNIATTGATTCATGNVGCAMHISSEAAAHDHNVRIVHPVELLHRAVFGGKQDS